MQFYTQYSYDSESSISYYMEVYIRLFPMSHIFSQLIAVISVHSRAHSITFPMAKKLGTHLWYNQHNPEDRFVGSGIFWRALVLAGSGFTPSVFAPWPKNLILLNKNDFSGILRANPAL